MSNPAGAAGQGKPRGFAAWFVAPAQGSVPLGAVLLNIALVLVLFSFAAQWVLGQLAYYKWDWTGVAKYREKFWNGWLVTVAVSAGALVLSTLVGVAAAAARRSAFLPLRSLAQIYVEVVRGTPLLVQILVLYYCVFDAVKLRDVYVSGVLILSLFSGAYISEMVRAGIENIAESQLESARAVGFTRWQTYLHVIFPQAFRQVLPPLAGQFASLIKDSSLLSIIALNELTLNAQEVNSFTYSAFESYLPLALGYFVLTFPISMLARWLERRFRYAA